jgi:hypothetical protein
MEPITKNTFDALMRYRGWPCVSVYLTVCSVPGTALWPGKPCQAIFRYEPPVLAR